MIGALLWSPWTTRNKFMMEGKFPSHPADIMFKCHMFLQQWGLLGRRPDVEEMTTGMERIQVVQAARQAMPSS